MKVPLQSTDDKDDSFGRGDGELLHGFRDDKELFIRAAFTSSPEKGLELLFREYYRPLCSHAMRFVFSSEIAKDIVADVFCNFLQRECFRRVESSYRFYLYRSVRNDCLKYLRQEVGRVFLNAEEDNVQEMPGSDTPESLLGYEELSRRIEGAIRSLPAQCQKVFTMNRYEGRKQQEIAAELGISIKTVEAHITKSLRMIRGAIQADWL